MARDYRGLGWPVEWIDAYGVLHMSCCLSGLGCDRVNSHKGIGIEGEFVGIESVNK